MQFYLSLEHDTFKTNVIDFLPVLKKIGPLPWAFGARPRMLGTRHFFALFSIASQKVMDRK